MAAHAGERGNGGLLVGLLVLLVLAGAFGAMLGFIINERDEKVAAVHAANSVVEDLTQAQADLEVLREQVDEARTQVFRQRQRLDACVDVVLVSQHQRAAFLAARSGRAGKGETREVNRLLNRRGYETYENLWESCA